MQGKGIGSSSSVKVGGKFKLYFKAREVRVCEGAQ